MVNLLHHPPIILMQVNSNFDVNVLFLSQANCIDSTAQPEAVFAGEVNKLKAEKIKPREQLTLEPYERDHAVVVGQYRYAIQIAVIPFQSPMKFQWTYGPTQLPWLDHFPTSLACFTAL